MACIFCLFFFNDTATTEIYTLSLHDALPIYEATGKLLDEDKSPSRRTGELDNRGSQFYIALYWAQALAAQTEDAELASKFASLAKQLADNESKIIEELRTVQGKAVDIGGYYMPDVAKMDAVMRPSATFNAAIDALL